MRCEQARQLFDAYLNGELSPSLTTELGAHRLRCPECRRALALLEVSGHILASDQDPVALRGDFTDRLMDCMKSPGLARVARFRRSLYVAGPLAAAAVVGLAFLGVFDRPGGVAAGKKSPQSEHDKSFSEHAPSSPGPPGEGERGAADERDELLERWLQDTEKNVSAKRESGETLQKAFELTVAQLLDILKDGAEKAPDSGQEPPPDDLTAPLEDSEADPESGEDVEDL